MNAVDSSVVIAAFASWHESHEAARRVVDHRPRLVAHCALEAYSVLTRLPAPYRVPSGLVVEFLADRFAEPPLTIPSAALSHLVADLARAKVTGGATYDGLVAMSAAAHKAMLLTLDHRAEATYRRCGIRFRLIEDAIH